MTGRERSRFYTALVAVVIFFLLLSFANVRTEGLDVIGALFGALLYIYWPRRKRG